MQILIAIVAFIFVIGLLILFHEGAHFIFAKRCGMRVDTFGIGFGPSIYKKKVGETVYRINAIPIGGYVKLVGEEEDFDVEDGFYTKPVFDKIKVVAAGSLSNFLLGLFILCVVGSLTGIPIGAVIQNVVKDSVASKVGLKPGDVIMWIDDIRIDDAMKMPPIIHSSVGKKLKLKIRRGERILIKEVIPQEKTINGKKIGIIGVHFATKLEHVSPIYSIKWGIEKTYFYTTLIITEIGKMLYKLIVRGIVPKEEVGGPIMIAYFAGKFAQLGAFHFLWFIAILSITLAIINLFPFPALDGGRLIFLFTEAITRRRLNPQSENFIHLIGFAILIFLIVCLVYNDLLRLFQHRLIIR